MKLTLISATNRPHSQTKRMMNFIHEFYRSEFSHIELQVIDLVDLPAECFTPAAYSQKPESLKPFVDKILDTDGILLVVPEYNGGAPGVLKYFIDLLPFPRSLQKKPASFVGVADGRFGALRACEHMQQVFEYRNAYVFPERTFIAGADKELDANGAPKTELTRKVLTSQLRNFVQFCEKLSAV